MCQYLLMKNIFVLLSLVFIVQSCGSLDDPGLQRIKSGSFNECSSIDIETLADNFFSSPSWVVIETADGTRYANLTGGMTFGGDPVDGLVQFSYPGEDYSSFEIVAFEMNDIPQNAFMISSLVTTMCNESL